LGGSKTAKRKEVDAKKVSQTDLGKRGEKKPELPPVVVAHAFELARQIGRKEKKGQRF